jgi:hypothetical protein
MEQITMSSEISYSVTPEKIFVLNQPTGEVFELEGVAREIWLLIASENTMENIAGTLFDCYDVDKDKLFSDVKEIMDEMRDRKIIGQVSPQKEG